MVGTMPTSSDEEDYATKRIPKRQKVETVKGLYLETVNRSMLDFDFEKLCSVSLNNLNVYGCLTCGKYFQGMLLACLTAQPGRGPQSNAYYHSMNEDHHVFINLETLKVRSNHGISPKVYVIPDGYEVHDPSLNDIKYVLKPFYTLQEVELLDTKMESSTDLYGRTYIPGFVGLNNLKQNDYINAVVHALAHVRPLRNYFLLEHSGQKATKSGSDELVNRFGSLLRKIWNPRAFKGHVSPHEFVQEVSRVSGKHFSIGKQADPIAFLSWLLNHLHKGLGFTSEKIPFLFLTLEPPETPLFAADEKNSIPQVPLEKLLQRFDGKSTMELKGTLKRYSIARLPEYLMFCIKRFTKNDFNSEKNPTILNFPVKNMDMSQCKTAH
ncbi:U4/U6.U5 tri-snRNP-associated protein 2 [Kappamyces sp. JEL0829]|nr:U4/U6.U5 tri-snRNP-associated protein 2 [Kappamyces sp. JEL0829]